MALYIYYGGLHNIEFTTLRVGGETMVYEELHGEYIMAGQVTDRIYQQLVENEQIKPSKKVGVYYGDPQRVSRHNHLRFEGGCLLDHVDSIQLVALQQKYKVKALPKCSYLTAEFPLKGFISNLVGIIKIYPHLEDYLDEKGIRTFQPITHIYDTENNKIIYRLQLPE
ncbi:MAG: hypothetical protein LUG18_08250 [Candidatus Azobacteroides sp.]|nr:hypothetical protein [Candidatus Azobacteroides sp.]